MEKARRHIVFVNRVFPPDTGATGQLLRDLARGLSALGWRVSIVTTKSHLSRTSTETDNGVTLVRVRGLPFRRHPFFYRALVYASLYPALIAGMFRAGRAEVFVIMSDPPLLLVLGAFFGRLCSAKVVYWAQDIYPDIAFATGLVPERSVPGTLLKRVMNRALDRCAAIVAVGRCMAEILMRKTAIPVHVVPNWADTAHVHPIAADDNPFRSSILTHAAEQIVMYSGNFGVAHAFAPIIDAMATMAVRRPRVRFVLIGEGPRLPTVKADIEKRGLQNVTFLAHRPYSELALSLTAADIHLACMDSNLNGLVVPSKIYGILAAGRPCLYLGPRNSEGAMVIATAGAGEVLEPERQGELASRLEEWLDHPERMKDAGIKARAAVESSGLAHAVAAFDALLTQTIARASA